MDLFDKILAEATAMNVLEIIAVVTAIVYVVLASLEKIACWFFGIVSSLLFVYIFFKVNYQLEAILNIFYVAMGIYGWYEWRSGLRQTNSKAEIISFGKIKMVKIILVGLIFSAMAGYLFDVYLGSSKPYLDALTTVFAMITTWMVARKILENWLCWIVIDILSIYLYLGKELYFTSLLFIIYIIISVIGYFSWRKSYYENLT